MIFYKKGKKRYVATRTRFFFQVKALFYCPFVPSIKKNDTFIYLIIEGLVIARNTVSKVWWKPS